MSEYRAWIIQDGRTVATAYGRDYDATEREGLHYLLIYGQDQSATMHMQEKVNGAWRKCSGDVRAKA